jgi:hypothetical protein
MNPGLFRSLLWAAALLTALAGCSQNSGETCQVDGDCASGLKCDARASGNERGTCFDPKAKVDSGAEKTDSGQPDLPDAASIDTSAADAASPDGDAG